MRNSNFTFTHFFEVMVKCATSQSHVQWSVPPNTPTHIIILNELEIFSHSNAHYKVKIIKWGHPKNPFYQLNFETGKYAKARAAEDRSPTGKVNPPPSIANHVAKNKLNHTMCSKNQKNVPVKVINAFEMHLFTTRKPIWFWLYYKTKLLLKRPPKPTWFEIKASEITLYRKSCCENIHNNKIHSDLHSPHLIHASLITVPFIFYYTVYKSV